MTGSITDGEFGRTIDIEADEEGLCLEGGFTITWACIETARNSIWKKADTEKVSNLEFPNVLSTSEEVLWNHVANARQT